jgi:hypothetical protein
LFLAAHLAAVFAGHFCRTLSPKFGRVRVRTKQGDPMATSKSTFQKRQKEMKRQEKQRMKAERRAQKKLEGPSEAEPLMEPLTGPLVDPQGLFSDSDSEN